jgi:hypothetical protein
MTSNNKKNNDDYTISRKDFLKRSLAAGFFFNLNYHSFTRYPIQLLSGNNGSKAGRKQSNIKPKYWHDKIRELRYHPEGKDFVITNGKQRFNRALYGTQTAFRIETSDVPEFALYMPGMGGTLKFGLLTANASKWLNNADQVITRYQPGSMIYEIHDSLLGKGILHLKVLAIAKGEGIVVRCDFKNITKDKLRLVWAFGGASDAHFPRSGDIGTDHNRVSGFSLLPEHCRGNKYKLSDHSFLVQYGSNRKRELAGVFDPRSKVHIADANYQESPANFFNSSESKAPAIAGRILAGSNQPIFINIYNPATYSQADYASVPAIFEESERARENLTNRVKLNTPDSFVNPFGGALSIAADAIWEPPTYLHGAVAWRVRLDGWRGPYVADPLGWHDRAKMHFNSYAESQLTNPDSGPVVPDPAMHLARPKQGIGTAVYTSGYICPKPGGHFSADHYDMNLDYIDELLWHFKWTGNWSYIKKMWPVLKRHLAWEKRCFDGNDDGLYSAFACIWASDALEYSGGGVTYSSAFNYRSNQLAAFIAERIGEDAQPYRKEAEKILQAVNEKLWMPMQGWYAEFQDLLGLRRNHPNPGLWTIYHAIDSGVADPFKAYQAFRYVDTEIPHIPVRAKGLPDDEYHVISTTNWMPYIWSVNNVAMAENLHTSLAYWQTGRVEKAFHLWKSTIIDNMYLGISPGNFEQVSFYDAMRGELYRDFADTIGIAGRTLVEGLFGIVPNAMKKELLIRPGLPSDWNQASLEIPDLSYEFKRTDNIDRYMIEPHFLEKQNLRFIAHARSSRVQNVRVNGQDFLWKNMDQSVGQPALEINIKPQAKYEIKIEWAYDDLERIELPKIMAIGDSLKIWIEKAQLLDVYDPQGVLHNIQRTGSRLNGEISENVGNRILFVKLHQGDFIWWEPVCFEVRKPVEVLSAENQTSKELQFRILNNTSSRVEGKLFVSNNRRKFKRKIRLKARSKSPTINVNNGLLPGTNHISIARKNGEIVNSSVINWKLHCPSNTNFNTVNLSNYFNDKVTNIFQNKYEMPRSPYPTYQLPSQGIGYWTSPLVQVNIDDSGLRKRAGLHNKFILPQGIPFKTPGFNNSDNIIFTSQWDNYPKEIRIPLSGSASHIYFLMAGSTNAMQSRFVNGTITIEYQDGCQNRLKLKNPETWWPIEQDYYIDDYAFLLDVPKPIRVHLKTGLITQIFKDYTSIDGLTEYAIDGGAATVLDLPLDSSKELKKLHLETIANNVIIGLMSLTLVRVCPRE